MAILRKSYLMRCTWIHLHPHLHNVFCCYPSRSTLDGYLNLTKERVSLMTAQTQFPYQLRTHIYQVQGTANHHFARKRHQLTHRRVNAREDSLCSLNELVHGRMIAGVLVSVQVYDLAAPDINDS